MAETKQWNEHQGVILDSVKEFDVIDCSACGFKHVIPIPTEKFLSNYYQKDFVNNRQVGFFKKMKEDAQWWEIIYNEKYDLFEKHINKKNRSILDIGSGLGYFLKRGKDRGWITLGIEPSVESFEYAQALGLVVVNEYLSEDNYEKLGSFDVVHMHEVLEHLPDPQKMIKLVKKMLKPGGFICIVSPNDFNPLQEAFIASNDKIVKWWVSPPEHINYFDFGSARKLLERHGFNILEQTSTFPLEFFLLMGDNYIGNHELGRTIHSKRKNIEIALQQTKKESLRRELYCKFSELGLGREFIIIAKKDT